MKLEFQIADIAKQPSSFEAIVNSANSNLRLGSGLSGAIHTAAGPKLEAYCQPLAPLPLGKAIITPGFNLPNPWIIHVRSSHYLTDDNPEAVMAEALRSMFRVAGEHNIKSLAMPVIGTGIFEFPYGVAADLIIKAIQNDALELAPSLQRIRVCLPSIKMAFVFAKARQLIDPSDQRPKTVTAAVLFLLETLTENSLRELTVLKEDELIQTHFGLGSFLRNDLLFRNYALQEDTGERDTDDASGAIVRALWQRLNQSAEVNPV
jgi:O-acetyl-ADP-ribose deacetylase (regulator of RNase III)